MPKIVLVVDDDIAFSELAQDILHDHGFQSVAVHSAPEALDWLKSGKPDAVLLDLRLPGSNGIDLLRALKSDPQLTAVPVMVCTVSQDIRDKEGVLKLGAADFIHKSTYLRGLIPSIQKAIGSQGDA